MIPEHMAVQGRYQKNSIFYVRFDGDRKKHEMPPSLPTAAKVSAFTSRFSDTDFNLN
jgi:hypothetical protein